MNTEYCPSCEDKLAWKEIDQLHEATLQISRQCFEYKKLCVGFVGIICGLVIKFTNNTLDFSLFTIGLMISVGFWIADANAYYFQKKVRSVMDHRMNLIIESNDIKNKRVVAKASWKEAFLNPSMALYYVMIIFSLVGAISFIFGWIK